MKMAHTVMCFASVYFTAIVGCAFSSPRHTVESRQHIPPEYLEESDQVNRSVRDNSTERVTENTVEVNGSSENLLDEDAGGGEQTTETISNTTVQVQNNSTTIHEESVQNRIPTGKYLKDKTKSKDPIVSVVSTVNISSNHTINESESNVTTDSTRMSAEQFRRNVQNMHIQAFQQRLLDKLRLREPPQLNGTRPYLPFRELAKAYMNDGPSRIGHYRRLSHPSDFYAKHKQVYVMGSDVTRECINVKGTVCYYFNLTGKVDIDEVGSAVLWVYKLFNYHDPYLQTFIVSELDKESGRRLPINMVKRVETRFKSGWLKITLTKSVLKWLRKPWHNHGVAILCRECRSRSHKAIFSYKKHTKPFLVINVRKAKKRSRRNVPITCTETTDRCCLMPLTINFHHLGWESMIHPVEFEANYCTGSCHSQQFGHFNHTQMVQNHRWNLDEWNTMRQLTPCCAPISYRSLSIVYMHENSIEVVRVPNMVATACGCL